MDIDLPLSEVVEKINQQDKQVPLAIETELPQIWLDCPNRSRLSKRRSTDLWVQVPVAD